MRGLPSPVLPRVHYAWVIVAAAAALVMTLGEAFYTFGVFFNPLREEFGWGRAATSSGYTAMILAFGISNFFMGRLSDKYGPRPVLAAGGLISSAGFILLGQTQGMGQFLVYSFLVGLGAGAFWPIPTATVQRWFAKRRGTALGIVIAGGGMGAVFTPVANHLISAYGWRTAYVILGLLFLAIVSVAASLMVHSPEKKGCRPYGADAAAASTDQPLTEAQTGWTTRDALTSRSFLTLQVVYTLSVLPMHVINAHLVPFAVDAGISRALAAGALALFAAFTVPGRFLAGVAADRIGFRTSLALANAGTTAASLWLLGTGNLAMLYVFVIGFGFFHGGKTANLVGLIGQFYGTRSLGGLIGICHGVNTVISAAGPLAAGWLFDATGSYYIAFAIVTALYAGAAVFSLFLRPPRP